MKLLLLRYKIIFLLSVTEIVFGFFQPVNAQLTVFISGTNVTCNGGNDGTASVTPSGGNTPYSYLWSDNEITDTIINLQAGTYTVTVTDNSADVVTASITITESPPLTPTITGNLFICKGGSTTISTQAYTSYLWSTGDTTQSVTVSPIVDSTFIVFVTDSNGCIAMAMTTVTVDAPAPTIECLDCSRPDSICRPSTITLTTQNYVNYIWSTGATTQSITVSPIATITYRITVTDVNGCTGTGSQRIQVTATPNAVGIIGGGSYCSGDPGVEVGLTLAQ